MGRTSLFYFDPNEHRSFQKAVTCIFIPLHASIVYSYDLYRIRDYRPRDIASLIASCSHFLSSTHQPQWSVTMAGSTTKRASSIAGQKRKRPEEEDTESHQAVDGLNGNKPTTTQSPSTKASDPSEEPTRKRGQKPKAPDTTEKPSNNGKPAKKSAKRVRSPTTWPEAFQSLSRIHRALNLVYTFCCTRKHFATTFDNIKKAVQAQMGGKELTVEDVARVKYLVPR